MRASWLAWTSVALLSSLVQAHLRVRVVAPSDKVVKVSTATATATSTLTAVASGATPTASTLNSTAAVIGLTGTTLQSTVLVIARDSVSASSATSGLNAYGIPFQILLVPSTGATLPALNSSAGGNYGGIIIESQVAYQYNTTYASALTQDQWNTLYAYQIAYGVRMVQFNVYPGPLFGATALGGCCDTGVEQGIAFSNTSGFTQAGYNAWATMSTAGIYHYPATIIDNSTWEIAQFAPNANFASNSTAAVINNYSGREQMVFFMSWATDWSATCNYLQHAYTTWMTRGLYAGYRRSYFNTQVDDMFLETDTYNPGNYTYRVTPDDMTAISNWVPKIQAKMNPGSFYKVEVGHNGNGNIDYSGDTANGDSICSPGAIDTGIEVDTPLEFVKPLGTGTNKWPTTPTTYGYSLACTNLDPLKKWWTSHLGNFMHISHTFTHLELNNATYSDALKEIQFNQAWMKQVGISSGNFTSKGLIPPAITGLHNGDVLRAWNDAGLTHCVGDNTRPPLRNQQNVMYPYTTTAAADGYDGYLVLPRWATRIYFNCDKANCTTQEWIDTSAGSGTFSDLMAIEKSDNNRHLFGLYHDAYMFHQANLRATGNDPITTADGTVVYSLFQAWVEQTVQEFVRLVNWPLITMKQDDMATSFTNRMARDACNYTMSYQVSNAQITGVTMSCTNNNCSVPVPLTVPGSVTSTQGFPIEKIGNDPLTIWVTLNGAPVTFTLSSPVALL